MNFNALFKINNNCLRYFYERNNNLNIQNAILTKKKE